MSVKVMGRVWDLNLPPNQKLVLMAYADAAEHDGTRSYPGHERLSTMTGYSRAQVQRITNQLLDNGLLDQVGEGHRGKRAEFTVKVLQDAPHNEEIVAHGSGDSGAQLRATSRPDPSYNASTASDGFTAFNAKRAVDAVQTRKRRGLAVKSEAGLAMTIQVDPEFLAVSRELWQHRECVQCKGKGMIETYSPGAGMTAVKCDA